MKSSLLLFSGLLAFAAATASRAQSPSPTPNSIDGGTIILATPTPLPTAPMQVNGGTISTSTPAPIAVLPSTAAAVAQQRRLVRDVQTNTDNIKSKGNFGAQLWMVGDSDFFLSWRKPETPMIAPIDVALRNQPIYTAIIFYGAAHDKTDNANVSYDITVRRPDKTIYTVSKDLVGFQNLAVPDERELQLGRNYVGINLGLNDPPGLWTIEALVHDNVGRVDLPLVQHFVLQPQ